MKKFVLFSAFVAAASLVSASAPEAVTLPVVPVAQVADVVAPAASVVVPAAPVVDSAAPVVVDPAAKVAAPAVAAWYDFSAYLPACPAFVKDSAEYVDGAIVAHPYRAMAVAAVLAVVATKVVDYATAGSEDDEDFA